MSVAMKIAVDDGVIEELRGILGDPTACCPGWRRA